MVEKMLTIELTTGDSEKWDEIVTSFKEYDVYNLSGYVKAFEINGDGKAILFYCEGQNTRAINIFIKRDISEIPEFKDSIPCNTYFDIVTPYGYGGLLIEGTDVELVMSNFHEYCSNNNIISEFVRFNPLIENHKLLDKYYEITFCGNTVFMDTSQKENIWNNITSKNRNMIRKAKKSGLKTYWGRNPQIIDSFMSIYNETMKKDNAADYYYFKEDFYRSILEDLKDNAMWFYTLLEGEIASIAIFMYGNGKMHYHLSASRSKYQMYAPSNLMLYEAALWANVNGYLKLHLGGGLGAQEDSLYKFKKAFNRNENAEFYIGKKIYNKKVYEELVNRKKMLGNKVKEGYFPEYRA